MALSTERLAEAYLESQKVIDNKKATRWLRDLLVESLSPTTWRNVYEYVEMHRKQITATQVAVHFGLSVNHASIILGCLSKYGLLDRELVHDKDCVFFSYQLADN